MFDTGASQCDCRQHESRGSLSDKDHEDEHCKAVQLHSSTEMQDFSQRRGTADLLDTSQDL